MVKADFGKADMQLTCPVEGCGAPIHTDLNSIAANATVLCSRGHRVKLDAGSVKLENTLDDLNKAFNQLNGKTFRIG